MILELCTDLLAFTLQLRKSSENLSQETFEFQALTEGGAYILGNFQSLMTSLSKFREDATFEISLFQSR